jgi:hypothetical protein
LLPLLGLHATVTIYRHVLQEEVHKPYPHLTQSTPGSVREGRVRGGRKGGVAALRGVDFGFKFEEELGEVVEGEGRTEGGAVWVGGTEGRREG